LTLVSFCVCNTLTVRQLRISKKTKPECRFYIPLNINYVISETFFPLNSNVTLQEQIGTNTNTAAQNKRTKLCTGLIACVQCLILKWNKRYLQPWACTYNPGACTGIHKQRLSCKKGDSSNSNSNRDICIAPPTGRSIMHHKTIISLYPGRLEQKCSQLTTKSSGPLQQLHFCSMLTVRRQRKPHHRLVFFMTRWPVLQQTLLVTAANT